MSEKRSEDQEVRKTNVESKFKLKRVAHDQDQLNESKQRGAKVPYQRANPPEQDGREATSGLGSHIKAPQHPKEAEQGAPEHQHQNEGQ